MKNREKLAGMIELATKAHSGQFDIGGHPYILHCLTVMRLLDSTDEELQMIAIGHDLAEDTAVTLDDIQQQFGDRVADAIDALTKRDGEKYDGYLARVKGNPDAIRVKMADLRHNTDFTRLRGVTKKDTDRLGKYARAYAELETALMGA